MTKVEIYTFSLIDKESDTIVRLEETIVENLYKKIFKDFPKYIHEAPPKTTYKDSLKVYAKNEKSEWSGSSKYGRINGIIVVGRDKDKFLTFTKADKEKSQGGEKGKDLFIDKRHYFDLIMPKNKSNGFLVLERTDGKSYKKHITSLLKKFIPNVLPGVKVQIEKFVEKDLVINFLGNGSYSKLELIRKEVPSDLLTQYLRDYKNKGTYTLKTAIISEDETDFPDKLKNELVKAVQNEQTYFSIPEFENIGFEQGKTNLRITSEFEGRERTIDLSNTMKLNPIYDIDIELEDDGFVEFGKMRKEITKLLQSFELNIL